MSAASRNRNTRWSGTPGVSNEMWSMVIGPGCAASASFSISAFEKRQVGRAIVPRVARLALPRLRIERLGQSLRGSAVDAAFGLECGRLDPGEQRGTTRWLAGDHLCPGAAVLKIAGTEVNAGSKMIRWCDLGTAETRDSSSARPRPGFVLQFALVDSASSRIPAGADQEIRDDNDARRIEERSGPNGRRNTGKRRFTAIEPGGIRARSIEIGGDGESGLVGQQSIGSVNKVDHACGLWHS